MDRSLKQVVKGRAELESDVLNTIEGQTAQWGIEAESFSITNLAVCRTIRLLQE